MNREIVIDKNMFERNAHGSFGFPINLLHIVMSDYPFGRFNGHWHPEIEITYIAGGEMQYQVNEVAYTLKKGDCIFVNRNVLHAGAVGPGTDCIFIVFDFNPILVTGYENSVIDEKYVSPVLNAESFSSCIFTGVGAAHASIQQLVAQMEQHYTGREECYELAIKSILNAIWALIYRQFTAQAADTGTQGESKLIQRVKKAFTFIYEHYSEPITLDEMASACHTSKSEFCRLFKAAMHQTPFDFLLHYRIQKSLPLLCSTDQSVTEIAGCVGFSGSSYYSEVFRKFMQCSPTEYRRNNAAQPQA